MLQYDIVNFDCSRPFTPMFSSSTAELQVTLSGTPFGSQGNFPIHKLLALNFYVWSRRLNCCSHIVSLMIKFPIRKLHWFQIKWKDGKGLGQSQGRYLAFALQWASWACLWSCKWFEMWTEVTNLLQRRSDSSHFAPRHNFSSVEISNGEGVPAYLTRIIQLMTWKRWMPSLLIWSFIWPSYAVYYSQLNTE